MTIKWTAGMVTTLIDMRLQNEPIAVCAGALGMAVETAGKKCRPLGIADRRNKGSIPGIQRNIQRNCRLPLARPAPPAEIHP